MTPELLTVTYAISNASEPGLRLFATIGLACDLARGEDTHYAVSEAQTCLLEGDPQGSGVRPVRNEHGVVVAVDPGPEFPDDAMIDLLCEVVMLPTARARFAALEALLTALLSNPQSDPAELGVVAHRAVAAVGTGATH